jgi:hypothetical protein
MRPFLLVIGALWLVMATVVGLQLLLSPRHRRLSRLVSRPFLTLPAMIIVGVGSVVAVFSRLLRYPWRWPA